MKKKTAFAVVSALLTSAAVFAQNSAGPSGPSGPSGGKCTGCVQPADGSGTLGFIYRKDTCGLDYVTVSQKIGQRFSPPGLIQPVTMTVAGIPAGAIIDKAFLWCDASGTGAAITAAITNPASTTLNFPMTLIGSQPDKCWGYAGTFSYRADVTSVIAGNGNYIFSGFPVGAGDDVDGIAMTIIYYDPTSPTKGHIIIHDGAVEISGGVTTQSITAINATTNSTSSRAFMLVSDLQNLGATLNMNNGPAFTITEDWWNYVDQPSTTVTPAQTTSDFTITSTGDCYNIVMIGLYFNDSCSSCAPSFLNVNATSTPGCGGVGGTMSATVTGGQSPYTYNWQPGGNTTSTVTNVTAGTYVVTVSDASGCASGADTVVVLAAPFPNAQFTLTPAQTAFYPGEVCMTDQTQGGTAWTWYVDGVMSDTSNSWCFTLPDTGYYCMQLIVLNATSCPDTAEQCLVVLGEAAITFPNVFTPNGDNVNDVFLPTWIGLTGLHCMIYDRWGALIYEWNGLTGSWNGKTDKGDAVDGVYYFTAEATTIRSETVKLNGFVHLLRNK
jgi:gliding motility-associated-like protein